MSAQYRVGIIGCSGIAIDRWQTGRGGLHLPQLHSHASAYHATPATSVVAVCDIVPAATARYVKTWGPAATYTDYRQLLEREKVDLLSIVTPDHLHAEIFADACAAGVRGIFCEKPIATTLADADRMIAVAERSGVKVLVNHTRRFDATYRQARRLLSEGRVGRLARIVGTMGGERAMLFRNGTHLVDTILYFADAEPAWLMAELDADAGNYGPRYAGDGGRDPATDPGASAYIHFTNGVRAFYNGSKGTTALFEFDLLAAAGRIRIGNGLAEWATPGDAGLVGQPLTAPEGASGGMVTAVGELIELVERGGDGAKALREARVTLSVLLAILASADRGGARIDFPLSSDPA